MALIDTEKLTKRVAIDRANFQVILAISIASFVTVFCLIASKSILSQNNYQARVIDADKTANNQLKTNITAYNNLARSYNNFVSTSTNVIGGSSSGSGPNSGNNAVLILDALPDKYDFPALTASVQKILASAGFNVTSITGTDDELNQQSNTTSSNPQPVSMPFTFSISGTNYAAISGLVTVLQQSIRPISIDTMDISGGGNSMTVTITAHTYYQPGKTLNITKQVIQ